MPLRALTCGPNSLRAHLSVAECHPLPRTPLTHHTPLLPLSSSPPHTTPPPLPLSPPPDWTAAAYGGRPRRDLKPLLLAFVDDHLLPPLLLAFVNDHLLPQLLIASLLAFPSLVATVIPTTAILTHHRRPHPPPTSSPPSPSPRLHPPYPLVSIRRACVPARACLDSIQHLPPSLPRPRLPPSSQRRSGGGQIRHRHSGSSGSTPSSSWIRASSRGLICLRGCATGFYYVAQSSVGARDTPSGAPPSATSSATPRRRATLTSSPSPRRSRTARTGRSARWRATLASPASIDEMEIGCTTVATGRRWWTRSAGGRRWWTESQGPDIPARGLDRSCPTSLTRTMRLWSLGGS
ncbi:WAS/WASL-interacting protein family member 1-like [Triticum urartu]|uniref:WAS/WASL-interacting protein family member 1-like n=1 Tax=Triticum urartu TaxID=4572 RepID=UPI002042EAB3|nr:WAS/WASL-interacting protein family member 1-like [Triticum urartu]